MSSTISPSRGNRPSAFFENTFLPSTTISNTPPPLAISSLSAPVSVFNSAARPTARGL